MPYERKNWIAADVVRVADGLFAEHWYILQDEATEGESQGDLPMFGTKFPGSDRGRKSPNVARRNSDLRYALLGILDGIIRRYLTAADREDRQLGNRSHSLLQFQAAKRGVPTAM